MVSKAETLIVRNIMAYLKKVRQFDGYHVHGNVMQRGGEPDIDGSVMTKVGWLHLKIEVKTPTGEPTERQIARLRNYHKRDYVAGVVTSATETEMLIQAYEEFYQDYIGYLSPPPFGDYLLRKNIEDRYGLYD